MSMEEKNEWVIQYVNQLAKQINEQYNNIVKKEHIDKVFSMYKDSEKEIETIKEEIDKMVKEFIENYLKRMQEIREEMLRKKQEEQEKMLEQLRELNPSVQIDIQNEIKNEQIESKIISSVPKEQLNLSTNISIDEKNIISSINNTNDLDNTFIATFPNEINSDLNYFKNEESKFKKTEAELKKTSDNYLTKFENCDIESLKKLDIIYTYNKINTAINMTPKGEKDNNKINEEIEKGKKYLFKQIKDVYNIEKIDDLHSFILKIKDAESKKTDSAYNILMQYKDDLKKTYKDNKGDVKIILSTHNLKEINAAKHRENQFFNEIVDGVYSVGSYEGMMAYITRANVGSMIANKESISLPNNPFDISKSNEQVLSFKKPVSVYSASVDHFEPVVDFSLTKDNKINLRFDNEWISREEKVQCTEQIVNTMPSSILDKRNIIVKDNNQSINIKEQINNKKANQQEINKDEPKQIPKQPSIPSRRQEEKKIKNTKPVKMNNFEKKAYPPLKQKQSIKMQARKQVQNNSNVKTLKNNFKGTSNKGGTSGNGGSKGFISIILGSIIAIVLGILLFTMIR